MAKSTKPVDGQLPSLAMPASTYHLSGDIAEVKDRVIARFSTNEQQQLGHLVNANIACLKRQSKRSEDAFSVDGSGGAVIRSDRDRGIPNVILEGGQILTFDALVWFRAKHWDAMDPARRDAWMYHQLSHLHARPSGGGLVRVGHDVEAFADEPVHFGAWEDQLALFEQNLDQYTPGTGFSRPKASAKASGPSQPGAPVN